MLAPLILVNQNRVARRNHSSPLSQQMAVPDDGFRSELITPGREGSLSNSPGGLSVASTGASRLITFSPRQLFFAPPLDNVIENSLLLTNTTPSCVAWKLYHKSPFRYRVSAETGFLRPHQSVNLKISYLARHLKDGGREDPSELTDERFILEARAVSPDLEAENAFAAIFKKSTESKTEKVRYIVRCIFGAELPQATPDTGKSMHPKARAEALRVAELSKDNEILAQQLNGVRRIYEACLDEERRNKNALPRLPNFGLEIPLPLTITVMIFSLLLGRVIGLMADHLIDCKR